MAAMVFTRSWALPTCDGEQQPSTRVLFSFDPAVVIENIAQTSQGNLLLTTLYDGGRVYSLDPTTPGTKAKVMATVPGCDGLTGIQEIAPSVFAVTGGPLGPTGFKGLKAFTFCTSRTQGQTIHTSEVADVPDSAMLNGLATLTNNPAVVLAADSFRGEVISINTITGQTAVAIQDDPFKPTTSLSLGINGLEVLGNYLYFTNSAQGIMARMRINLDGTKAAEAEILAILPGNSSRSNFFDDFAVRETGLGGLEIYIATQGNSIYKVLNGQLSLFLGGGNNTLLMVPTSVAISNDGTKLFVVTGGGQVVEVDL